MCLDCAVQDAGEFETWPEPTPLMLDVSDAIEVLYTIDHCGVGGPLHIVVDDHNVQDHHLDDPYLDYFRDLTYKKGSFEDVWRVTYAILWGLSAMTVPERAVTVSLPIFNWPAMHRLRPSHWSSRVWDERHHDDWIEIEP